MAPTAAQIVAPRIAAAQAPNACVVPTTANIYRIGLEGLPGSCRAGHAGMTLGVQFPSRHRWKSPGVLLQVGTSGGAPAANFANFGGVTRPFSRITARVRQRGVPRVPAGVRRRGAVRNRSFGRGGRVKLANGDADAEFSCRIVAKRVNYENERLERAPAGVTGGGR